MTGILKAYPISDVQNGTCLTHEMNLMKTETGKQVIEGTEKSLRQ